MKKKLSINLCVVAVVFCLGLGCKAVASVPVDVLPATVQNQMQSLNGDWKFKYVPSSEIGSDEKFFEPAYDVASWKSFPVPGHWELHGFAEPRYKKVDEGTGLYRRTFRLPAEWRGRRIMLRFDGVLYGLTAWVNGKLVGQWASSYNPVTFDITDALNDGGNENQIAIRVTTRSRGYDFDNNDCWAISGIYREVTLFAVPPTYLRDYTARTALKPDGSAEVELAFVASGKASVAGKLRAPDGSLTRQFTCNLSDAGEGATRLAIPEPQLWTAETPWLYQLELELRSESGAVQPYRDRIGLRQVTIHDGVLQLNGKPFKLRGVNHHDIWPDEGRVATEELLRRDLELMRAANINFIRTSHYPPHRRLIELCDEMGFYVMDEVPFGHGDNNLTDPSFEDVLRTRARATVTRDKNRPSVLIWSIGNENRLTELGVKTAEYTRQLDPSRPVCFPTVGSYFHANLDQFLALPESIEIFAPHYPGPDRIREYAARFTRPIIATEYSHSLGLGFDSMQELWEIFDSSPRTAGGAVWLFQDQGIRRKLNPTSQPVDGRKYVWPDADHYFDTAGIDGCDGIVYSDRTPQVDYWQVRKVYSPVRIVERRAKVRPGRQTLQLNIQNRHDFRTLEGMTLQWSLKINGISGPSGAVALAAKPRATEVVSIDLDLPADIAQNVAVLDIVCVNEASMPLIERSICLDAGGERIAERLLKSLNPSGQLKIENENHIARVIHPGFTVELDRNSGDVEIRSAAGQRLASGFLPCTGRKITLNEEARIARAKREATESDLREAESVIWLDPFLRASRIELAHVSETKDNVRIVVSGRYDRTDVKDQFLTGTVTLDISSSGVIAVKYAFIPVNTGGELLQAGLSLTVPESQSELRWLGAGPFAGYPGKDALNEFGIYRLNSKDIRFQGNRREIELSMLTRPSGEGVLLAGSAMDVGVENVEGGIIISHNALVAGRGNKGGMPLISLKADQITSFEGEFFLIPLHSEWPALLGKWFASTAEPTPVLNPFFSSYDQ